MKVFGSFRAALKEGLIMVGRGRIDTGRFVEATRKKNEVESQDECVLELAPLPGTVILSRRTSHPFIDIDSVLYRTRNCLFSSIWY